MRSLLVGDDKNRAREQPWVWLGAACLLAFMLLASVTGPTRVWTIPQDGPTEIKTDEAPETPEVTVVERTSNLTDLDLRFTRELLVVLVTALFVGFALLAIRALGFPVSMWMPRRRRRQTQSIDSVLPDLLVPVVQVDVEAAQVALIGGDSKDGIIRCWMQVQTDITAIGYEPVASETSAEYVERVIAQASVDPAPIVALASLYREARFSRHELTEVHRTQAADAVGAIAASLNSADQVGPDASSDDSPVIVGSQ